MKGEGHRDWENVIGRRSLGVNEYIQCHTIFARNVAMIELIYTVRSYTVWVKIEIVSKSALLGSSLRHVGSDNDAISYVSAGEPCPCLCSVSAWLLCTPTITLYRYAKHHVHVDRQSPWVYSGSFMTMKTISWISSFSLFCMKLIGAVIDYWDCCLILRL